MLAASKSLLIFTQRLGYFIPMIPAIFLGILLLNHSVDIPHWDQWLVTQTVIKSATGTLQWNDWIAQHNESRKFFPRLIFIALAHLTHYNVRYEIAISFLMAGLTSINLFILSRKTIQSPFQSYLFLAFLANLLIFSPVQYEACLIGLSNVVFIAIACLTSAILVAYTELNTKFKYLICILLCVISTFSFANGILSWVLVLPVLIVTQTKNSFRQSIYRDRWLIVGWIVAFGITAGSYFFNYQKPAWHPSLTQALMTPIQAVSYFFAFLGNPLGWGTAVNSLTLSRLIGIFLFTAFVGVLIYLIYCWQNLDLWRRSIGWLMLGFYSIFSAAIATLGRVGFGVDQSLSSRYTTFALYLSVSLIYLISILIQHRTRHQRFASQGFLQSGLTAITSVFLVFHVLTCVYSVDQMVISRQDRLQMKTCLAFINTAADSDCLKKLYWEGKVGLQPMANQLNSFGWITPKLFTTNQVQNFSTATQKGVDAEGSVDAISQSVNGEVTLSGWAVLLKQNRLPDALLLTYRTEQNEAVLLKVFSVSKLRRDVAIALNRSSYLHSGWESKFSLDQLPKNAISKSGEANISIWTFDLFNQQATLLKNLKLNG